MKQHLWKDMKFQAKKANSQTKNPYSVVLLWWVNPVWLSGAHQNAVSSISSAGEGEEIWWIHIVGCGRERLMVHPFWQSLSRTKQIQLGKINLAYSPSWSSAALHRVLQHGSFPQSPALQEGSAPAWVLHEETRPPQTLFLHGLLLEATAPARSRLQQSYPWYSGHIHVLHIHKLLCSTF